MVQLCLSGLPRHPASQASPVAGSWGGDWGVRPCWAGRKPGCCQVWQCEGLSKSRIVLRNTHVLTDSFIWQNQASWANSQPALPPTLPHCSLVLSRLPSQPATSRYTVGADGDSVSANLNHGYPPAAAVCDSLSFHSKWNASMPNKMLVVQTEVSSEDGRWQCHLSCSSPFRGRVSSPRSGMNFQCSPSLHFFVVKSYLFNEWDVFGRGARGWTVTNQFCYLPVPTALLLCAGLSCLLDLIGMMKNPLPANVVQKAISGHCVLPAIWAVCGSTDVHRSWMILLLHLPKSSGGWFRSNSKAGRIAVGDAV